MPEVPLQTGIAQLITQMTRPLSATIESMPIPQPRLVQGILTGNNTLEIVIGSAGTLRVQLAGTWTGRVWFETTLNLIDWLQTRMVPQTTAEAPVVTIPPTLANPLLASSTVNGIFVLPASAYSTFRVRGESVVGTVNVTLFAGAGTAVVATIPLTASGPVTILGDALTRLTEIRDVLIQIRDKPGPPV